MRAMGEGVVHMVTGLWFRALGWLAGLALLSGALLPATAQTSGFSQIAQLFYGPKVASIASSGSNTDVANSNDTFTVPASAAGPYAILVENTSNAWPAGKSATLEVRVNSVAVVSTADVFSAAGVPVTTVQRAVPLAAGNNSIAIKLAGKAPASFKFRVVSLVPSPPRLSVLTPNPLETYLGLTSSLRAAFEVGPTQAGAVQLSASNAGVVALNSSIAYQAGQTQVTLPLQAVGVGSAVVTARVDGGERTATVVVKPAPPRLVSVSPMQGDVQPGATLLLQAQIFPAQAQDVRLDLASSDPTKASVPASVIIPAGGTSVDVPVLGVAAGSAQVTARIVLPGLPVSSIAANVRVTASPLAVVSVSPPAAVLQQGATTTLTLQLSAASSQDTQVSLQAGTSGVVQLPSSVTVPAGRLKAEVALNAVQVGSTTVVATLGGSTAQAAVQVSPGKARVSAIREGTTTLALGAQTPLTVQLSAAVATDTVVNLVASPTELVQIPTQVTVPAGRTTVAFVVQALAAGQAQVTASLDASTAQALVVVNTDAPAVAALVPDVAQLELGSSGLLSVRLNAAQTQDQLVSLQTSDTTKLLAPTQLLIPAGQTEQTVVVQSLAVGQVSLTASLGASTRTANLTISNSPPQLLAVQPAALLLPKGKVSTLNLQLDRYTTNPVVATLTHNGASQIGIPASVTIPAGQRLVSIPVLALDLGNASITAQLNGSTAPATVEVSAPRLEAIELQPVQLSLTPGQSSQAKAIGQYSDGSNREITQDSGTVWAVSNASLAQVSASGLVTAVATGQLNVSASQVPAAYTDDPLPAPVSGKAGVTIGQAAALAFSASTQTLLVGQGASVSVSAPYPAGAQAWTIALSSNPTGALQHPTTVRIEPGNSSATFNVLGAAAGLVNLTAQASPFASGQIGFTVLAAPLLRVTAVEPSSAAVGATITLRGEGFDPTASANTVVFSGNALSAATSASATELRVTVPDAAQSGPIEVRNAQGTAQSPAFTVLREQDYTLQASPALLQLVQGTSTGLVIRLPSTGTRTFEGLAKLSVTGLPAGVTPRWDPAAINPTQTGSLTLVAESGAALGQATLTLKAEATLDGLPWVRQTTVNLSVLSAAGRTGVQGRFVTPTGEGVAGVIVRQDISTNQVVSDAAGNFTLIGLNAGINTLRMDATPANPLYPIWPYNVTLSANQMLDMGNWVINPPPSDAQFKPIDNATADQQITDERYPGFAITLPAGVSITGWDGVKKTRLTVQRIEPDRLPVGAPPFAMKEAYQLYFGTPMGGIPSAPIPVTLPNVAQKEPGEKVDIWWFDGSPMGGSGEWKLAGQGTVSADGLSVTSDPGVGIPRFCGVCGLFSIACPPVPKPPQTAPSCKECDTAGNSVSLYTGQENTSYSGGPSFGGTAEVDTSLKYNSVDAFNNRGGTVTSFGYGWTFNYDISFWPMSGVQKRLVMPGGTYVDMVDDGTGKYRPKDDPRHDGAYAWQNNGKWEVLRKDGTRWVFEPFAGVTGNIRGGPPQFVTQIIDTSGNTTAITRQSNGRIQSVTGSAGRKLNLSYGSNGFVQSMTDHTGRTQSYEYNADNRISAITDPASRATRYTYKTVPTYVNTASGQTACAADLPTDSMRLMDSILYPDSSTPTTNTHGTDRILAQTTSRGQNWQFAYKRVGACVTKLSDGSVPGKAWDYTCRAGQPLAARTCAEGTCTQELVGTCPDVESMSTQQAGWRFYGGAVSEATVTQPDGQQRRTRFNPRGMPIESVDPAGQKIQYVYDGAQRLIKTIDPLSRETRFEYDAAGNRTVSINPLGQRVDTAYDVQFNAPVQTTRYLLGVPSVDGGVQLSYTPIRSSAVYDSAGRLTQATDPLGLQSRIAYNAQGLPATLTAPVQVGTSSVKTISNGQTSTIAASSRTTILGYNTAGDVNLIVDALNNETRLSTDPLGRPVSTTDPLGYTSQTSYNNLDQPTQSTNPLQQTAQVQYDSAGRVSAIVNAAGVTLERYTYDTQGRRISKTDALNQIESYTYDTAGRLSTVIDRKGSQTRLTYNERGQIATVSKSDRDINYQYDAVGRLTEVRDAASVNRYSYDAGDRLTQTDSTTAAGSHRLAYQYDSLSRITQRTLSGTGISTLDATTYEWDKADRLTAHSTTIAGQAHKTSYSYDEAGRLSARKVQAGTVQDIITQQYGYDSLDRLSQIKYVKAQGTATEQLIEQIDYEYDANGRRTAKTTLNNNGAGGAETAMTASFDAGNRMSAITLNPNTANTKTYSLSYDANGNLTQKQNTTDAADKTLYTWDADNRLSRIEQGGTNSLTATFSYDAMGRRIQSSITKQGQPTSTVQYLYEGAQALGEIRDGKLSHRLLTGLSLDETIARIALTTAGAKDQAASRIFLTDALNSVIAQMSDSDDSTLQTSYAYSPYGASTTVGTDPANNPIQYTSRENDGTGLYYYRARYYDPVLPRFISEDPIGLAGGWNWYAYVAGSPLGFTDPTGEILNMASIAAGAIIGGISGGLGASATGGNVVAGVLLGAGAGAIVGAIGPFLTPGSLGSVLEAVAWSSGVRATMGALGSFAGQAQGYSEPCFPGFNFGAIIGSGLGGALGGVVAPGAWGTSFTSSFGAQVAQRSIANLPGAGVSGTVGVAGKEIGKVGGANSSCGCQK